MTDLRWQRAVLKIGSSLIAPDRDGLSDRYLKAIAAFITAANRSGRELVVVSSGAVAAGRALLPQAGDRSRQTLVRKQALAAVGQAQLMQCWASQLQMPVAQLLLTADDLQDRHRFVNARNTLRELLSLGCLPIINENDSVATDELKVGDNDNLAAHVAALVDADLLIIGSDIDGLYDQNPRTTPNAKKIAVVERIDATVLAMAGGSGSAVGTGGMITKLQAAERATSRGIATVIGDARNPDFLTSLLADDCQGDFDCQGTLFRAHGEPLRARKHWLQHTLTSRGQLQIDAGAWQALRERGASLLPSGIRQVSGDFQQGDAVDITLYQDDGVRLLGKGISQYDAGVLTGIRGMRSDEITQKLGNTGQDCAIHRDDLVLYLSPIEQESSL
ncbi:glutamate 5-kinase [Permianibacter sp. IMCC34836]|uniref:glutamate 5-kinase n=1 Tax=Permianibacter fluminis TaxID=2738515 RepID=UPI0015562F88|nr:glutamate 5-kinase [Permianibacter fluminis]NQD38154.1 glutamate 5-kinase [Permianibacter fluminis]